MDGTNGLGDFPEQFMDDDGTPGVADVKYERDFVDTIGADAVPVTSSATPCDCDPGEVVVLRDTLDRAVKRNSENSARFEDKDYREELALAYIRMLACSACFEPEEITILEEIMETHGIPIPSV